jgi:hypothetical protein
VTLHMALAMILWPLLFIKVLVARYPFFGSVVIPYTAIM